MGTQLTVPLSIGGIGIDLTGRLEREFDIVAIFQTNLSQNHPHIVLVFFGGGWGEGEEKKTYANFLTFNFSQNTHSLLMKLRLVRETWSQLIFSISAHFSESYI